VTILTLLRSAYWIRIITTTNNSASLAGRRQQQHRRSGRVRGSELNSVGASQARSSRSAVKQGTHRHRTSVTRARPQDAAGRAARRDLKAAGGHRGKKSRREQSSLLARAHARSRRLARTRSRRVEPPARREQRGPGRLARGAGPPRDPMRRRPFLDRRRPSFKSRWQQRPWWVRLALSLLLALTLRPPTRRPPRLSRDRRQWDWNLGLGEGGARVSCIGFFLSRGTRGGVEAQCRGEGTLRRGGRHGAEDFLRTKFVIHFILFSSRD
jgi:hypothetical protein